MFARWLFVRLSAAERALREGRLDDVCAAVAQEDVRQHARGQRLLDELVRPLLARARLHRQAGRFAEAQADLDRVEAFGRGGPEVEALRQQIAVDAQQKANEYQRKAENAADRREAVGRAAQELAAGRLETLRVDLQRVQDTEHRAALGEELKARLERAGQVLVQAATALERGDWLAAARLWQDACGRFGRSRESDEFAVRLAALAPQCTAEWLEHGRLDCLLGAGPAFGGLLLLVPAVAESQKVVELCGRAAAQFGAADYTGLRQTLVRLKGGRGAVEWLDRALAALADLTAAQEKLLASPLGLYASVPGSKGARWEGEYGGAAGQEAGAARPTPSWHPEALNSVALRQVPVDPNAVRLDRPLLMLVDGGGSSLLVSAERVRLGRAGGSTAVDVGLPCDVQSHHAEIVRHGEDYFLTAYGPVEVNGRRVEHTLLRDGDRLLLGGVAGARGPGGAGSAVHAGSARLVFARPSAKSASAVLRLSHRCRMAQDVGDVVLFRDTCLVGAGANCHLRTHEGDVQFVLFERGGALCARQTAGNGWLSAPARAVKAGETLDFADVRVTVRPYEA